MRASRRRHSGDVLIDGQVINTLEPYRRPVNMVFQSYALFPHLTVADNIGYGLRQRRPRLPRREIAEKVGRTLEIVRLSGFENRRVWEMSGGQQQRVALARAIVNQPKLLLLDEPLAALDRKLRKEMQIELQDLQRQLGITFVLVTHDQEEALSLSDRICVMRAGRIVQVGSPQDLYDHPNSRYVADFVGTSNFFDGRIETVGGGRADLVTSSGLKLEGRASAGLAGGVEGCLSIRPEQIRIARTPERRQPRRDRAQPHLPRRAHGVPRAPRGIGQHQCAGAAANRARVQRLRGRRDRSYQLERRRRPDPETGLNDQKPLNREKIK